MKHKGYNNQVTGRDHQYEFAGEEFEEDLEKNTVAYQWRDYDPAIARFNKIDRFAEKYVEQTPYHFTKNAPLFFKEMQGDSIWIFNESLKSVGHMGTHAFLRVKTKEIDVVIELSAPSEGRKTGTPSIKKYDPKWFKGGRGRVKPDNGLLIIPNVENPNERAEKVLLSLFNHFSKQDEDGNYINLPEYSAFGPNSNGFVKAILHGATSVEVGLGMLGIGEDETEFYEKEMNDFVESLNPETANKLLSIIEQLSKNQADKQEEERKKKEKSEN